MIIKRREKPLIIQKLEALLRRLPSDYPKIPTIKENLAKQMAGYIGETSLDFPLSYLSEKVYYIFHDIRLKGSKNFFQIDTLILSSKFHVLLEVKNMTGTLQFDQTFHQLIRKQDGKEEGFPDPLLQIQRQQLELTDWLAKHQIKYVPIYSFVVISNPSTIIESTPTNKRLHQKVIHRNVLPFKIQQLEQIHRTEILLEKELKRVCRLIKKHHTPIDTPVLQQYQLLPTEIQLGVHCPNCDHIPMRRIYGSWLCPACLTDRKDAHLSALRDYRLLIATSLTNQQAKEFLQVNCSSLTKRLLQHRDITLNGVKKGSSYDLTHLD